MWNKIKEFSGWIVAGVIGIFSLLIYLLKRKDEQLDAAKAAISLNTADKKSAILDTEIKELEKDLNTNSKEIDKINTDSKNLSSELSEALKKEENKNPKEVEDFWNKEL